MSRKNRERLMKFQKELKSDDKGHVSISTLVDTILDRFFEKEEAALKEPLHSSNE